MLATLLFLAGLVALVVGASVLVRGASGLALRLGISPLVVGLTVVAFGTSAPEMAVTTSAVLSGRADMAIGNAVGSNIFNVLFVLGLAALITPLTVHRQVIRQEAPIMVGCAALLVALSQDGHVGLFDGVLLLGLLVAYTVFLILQSRADPRSVATVSDDDLPHPAEPGRWDAGVPVQLALVLLGLVLLVAGSHALVSAATTLARWLGMSEAVIGLTIVAVGTSLPEVAASIAASFKGERDMAIGNVVGSCVFNILGVVGLGGLAASLGTAGALVVPEHILRVDLWVMLATTLACLPVFISGRTIARWEAALLLGYYAAYTAYLVMVSQRYGGTDVFGDIIVSVVMPLTIVTLAASLLPRRR